MTTTRPTKPDRPAVPQAMQDFLWDIVAKLHTALAELRLRLHPRKVQVMRASERADVFGYLTSRHRRWLRNDSPFALDGYASA
jgi:hypothetical protein